MRYLVVLCVLIISCPLNVSANTECSSPEHRQFDFWIGEWDVYDNSNGKIVGKSKVELILQDCVLLENWSGTDGFYGESFSLFESASGKWQQRWVDSRGQLIDFHGEFRDNAMRFAGTFRDAAGKSVDARMTFHKLPDSKVRQVWEQSADGGITFKIAFDGTYVPGDNKTGRSFDPLDLLTQ